MVEVAGLCASAPALEVIRPAGMAPFLRAQAKFFICSVRTLLFSTCAKAVATRWYVALMSLSTGSPVLVLSWYLLLQMSSEASCIGIVVITACALAFIATLGMLSVLALALHMGLFWMKYNSILCSLKKASTIGASLPGKKNNEKGLENLPARVSLAFATPTTCSAWKVTCGTILSTKKKRGRAPLYQSGVPMLLAQKQTVVVDFQAPLLLEQAQQILDLQTFPVLASDIEDHLALVQHHGAGANLQRLLHAMGYHQRREFLFIDNLFGQFQNKGCRFRVQGRRVFIKQQNAGGSQAGHQQAHCLALATGEQAHLVAKTVLQAQTQRRQAFPETAQVLLFNRRAQAAALPSLDRQRQVFLNGEIFTGPGQGVLEYPGYPGGPFMGG